MFAINLRKFMGTKGGGLLLLFILIFSVYSANLYSDFRSGNYRRLLTSNDAVPNTFLPFALYKYETFSFNELVQHLRRFSNWYKDPYFLVKVRGDYYSSYPPLTGLLAYIVYLPVFVLGKIPHIGDLYHLMKVLFMGRVTASLFASISALFVYLSLLKVGKGNFWPFVFSLFYALGTTTYSISSRSLWQHTTSQLFIAIALYLSLLSLDNPRAVKFMGFVLGLSVLARPTNAVIVVFIAFYVFLKHRKHFLSFVLAGLPSLIFMLFYNYKIFGNAFMEGYGARGDFRWTTPYSVSIPSLLFSPARSFLFISPPLVLGFYTMARVFWDKTYLAKLNLLLRFLTLSFVAIFLLFAKWYTWSGANGFGYRMLTDFVPIITLLAFLAFMRLGKKGRLLIVLALVYSVYIQFNAVLFHYSRCGGNHDWDFYCLKPPKEKITIMLQPFHL